MRKSFNSVFTRHRRWIYGASPLLLEEIISPMLQLLGAWEDTRTRKKTLSHIYVSCQRGGLMFAILTFLEHYSLQCLIVV